MGSSTQSGPGVRTGGQRRGLAREAAQKEEGRVEVGGRTAAKKVAAGEEWEET